MATYLSKRFTLEDLTRTETGKVNIPSQAVIAKLKELAQTLEVLWDNIGPFDILSGYRSQATQEALISSGNVQAVTTSYHTQGIAADIAPSTMKVEDYILKIAANPMVRYKLGQIALKGGALHISLPTEKFSGQLMFVDPQGQYIRKTDSEIANIIKQRLTQAVAAVKARPVTLGVLPILAIGALVYFILSRRK